MNVELPTAVQETGKDRATAVEVRAGAETVAETVGAQQLASRASGLGNEEGAPRQSLSLLAPLNRFQNFPLPCPWAVRIRPETR